MSRYVETAAALPAADPRARPVAIWLFVLAAMVFIMVVLGGVTRLTGSGLSMVDWQPVLGWLPPLSEADWQAAFDRYREYPEYVARYPGMTVAEFRGIFWLEYIHRLWGRIIGLAFLVPFVWFLVRGRIGRPHILPLAGLFVLGGLQGGMGWYMVASGLVDRPDVSQYRLTAHLFLAVLIYGWLLATGLRLLRGPVPASGAEMTAGPGVPRVAAWLAAGLATLTFLSGGFVAGLDAGFAWNTFPLMDGALIAPGAWSLDPWWLSAFEDPATVQFNHRVLAMVTLAAILWLPAAFRGRTGPIRRAAWLVLAVGLAQVSLGIATLLSVVAIPLAALHQATGLVLLTALLWLLHAAGLLPGTRAAG